MSKYTYIKTFFIILAFFLSLQKTSIAAEEYGKTIVNFQGHILLAYDAKKYFELIRLDPEKGFFYGYGWLENNKVFVAYSKGDTAESSSKIKIFEIDNKKVIELDELGGMGEANFIVNTSVNKVAFSQGDSIYLFSLDFDKNQYFIYKMYENVSCWGVFWVSDDVVGCQAYNENTKKMSLVKYNLNIDNNKIIKKIKLNYKIKEFNLN